MKKQLLQLTVSELQSLLLSLSKRFISSLEEGTPVKLLQPLIEQIKEVTHLLDKKGIYQ